MIMKTKSSIRDQWSAIICGKDGEGISLQIQINSFDDGDRLKIWKNK